MRILRQRSADALLGHEHHGGGFGEGEEQPGSFGCGRARSGVDGEHRRGHREGAKDRPDRVGHGRRRRRRRRGRRCRTVGRGQVQRPAARDRAIIIVGVILNEQLPCAVSGGTVELRERGGVGTGRGGVGKYVRISVSGGLVGAGYELSVVGEGIGGRVVKRQIQASHRGRPSGIRHQQRLLTARRDQKNIDVVWPPVGEIVQGNGRLADCAARPRHSDVRRIRSRGSIVVNSDRRRVAERGFRRVGLATRRKHPDRRHCTREHCPSKPQSESRRSCRIVETTRHRRPR